MKSNFCTLRRILHTYFSPVPTHFPARDHYENYVHILGMKMKEIYIFDNGFPEVNISVEISKDNMDVKRISKKTQLRTRNDLR